MITLHVNTQPAFMLVVIRLSPILPPSFSLSLSLSLTSLNFFGPVSTMASSLSAVTVTNRPIVRRSVAFEWQSISVLWISIDKDVSHIPRNRTLFLQVTLLISHRVNLINRKKSEQRNKHNILIYKWLILYWLRYWLVNFSG